MNGTRGAVTATAAVLALAGCGGLPIPSDSSTSPATSATLTREARWQQQIADAHTSGSFSGATVVDGVVALQGSEHLTVLDARTGKQRWRRPAGLEQQATVADGVVAFVDQSVGDDSPDPARVEVVDLKTGKVLWKRAASNEDGSVAAFRDAVYTRDCPGANETGCTMSKRALRTGKALWTRPDTSVGRIVASEAGPRPADGGLRPPAEGRLVPYVPLYGEGGDRRRRAVDARTGKSLRAAVAMPEGADPSFRENVAVTGKTLAHGRGSNDDEQCRVRLDGYDARTGRRSWRADVRSCVVERPSVDFSQYHVPGPDSGSVVVNDADGRLAILDLDSGSPRWTSRSKAKPIAVAGDWVLARESLESGPFSVWNVRTGEPAWQTAEEDRVRIAAVVGDSVVIDTENDGVVVRSAETGKERFAVPGEHLMGAGPGWLVTSGTAGGTTSYFELDR